MVPARKAQPDAVSSEPLVNLNARVPKHLWRRVRLQCLREGRLLRSFITEALQEYLRARTR
jgi:predicted HicB family RNase H-like nuclease